MKTLRSGQLRVWLVALLAVAAGCVAAWSLLQPDDQTADFQHPLPVAAGEPLHLTGTSNSSLSNSGEQQLSLEVSALSPRLTGTVVQIGQPMVARVALEAGQVVLYSAAPPAVSLQRTVVGPAETSGDSRMRVSVATGGRFGVEIPNYSTVVTLPSERLVSDLGSITPGEVLASGSGALSATWTVAPEPPPAGVILGWFGAGIALVAGAILLRIATAAWAPRFKRLGVKGSVQAFRGSLWRRRRLAAGGAAVAVIVGLITLATCISPLAAPSTVFREVRQDISQPSGVVFNGVFQAYPDLAFYSDQGLTWSDKLRSDFDGQVDFRMPRKRPAEGADSSILTVSPISVVANQTGELVLNFQEDVYPVSTRIGQFEPGSEHHLRMRLVSGQRLETWIDGSLSPAVVYLNQPVIPVAVPTSISVNGEQVSHLAFSLTQTAQTSQSDVAKAIDAFGQVVGGLLVLCGTALVILCWFVGRPAPAAMSASSRSVLRSALIVTSLGAVAAVGLVLSNPQSVLPGGSVGWSRNWPLFADYTRFSDYFQVDAATRDGDPYTVLVSWYPPLGHAILGPLTNVLEPRGAFVAFIAASLGIVIGVIAWVYWRARWTWQLAVFGTIALSFPVWFAIDRGNTELLIGALAMFGVAALLYERSEIVGGAVLALTGFAKIWPGFLLFPWLRGPGLRNRVLLGVLAGAIAAVVLSAVYLDGAPLAQYSSWLTSVQSLQGAESPAEMCNVLGSRGAYGTSVFSFAAAWLTVVSCGSRHPSFSWLQSSLADLVVGPVPMIATAIALIATATLMLVWRTPRGLAVSLLAVATLLFPLPSVSYRGVVLLSIVVALPAFAQIRHPRTVGIFLGLSLSCMPFWYFGSSPGTNIDSAALLTPIVVLGLWAALWREIWLERRASRFPVHRSSTGDSTELNDVEIQP